MHRQNPYTCPLGKRYILFVLICDLLFLAHIKSADYLHVQEDRIVPVHIYRSKWIRFSLSGVLDYMVYIHAVPPDCMSQPGIILAVLMHHHSNSLLDKHRTMTLRDEHSSCQQHRVDRSFGPQTYSRFQVDI